MSSMRSSAVRCIIQTLVAAEPCSALYAQDLHSDQAVVTRTQAASAAGVFLRYADSPTTDTHRVAFNTQGGFDSSRRSGTAALRAELVVLGSTKRLTRAVGLSLLAGASYFSPAARAGYIAESRVNAAAGVKVQPLFQAAHGIDGALSISYVSHDFNLSPAIATTLLLARSFAETQLILNVDYGQSFARGDRYGRVRAASLSRVIRELRLGFDARASFDLGFDDDTPGEAAYELTGGPLASYALQHVVISVGGGPSLLRFTDKPGNGEQRGATLLGYALNIGVGAAL